MPKHTPEHLTRRERSEAWVAAGWRWRGVGHLPNGRPHWRAFGQLRRHVGGDHRIWPQLAWQQVLRLFADDHGALLRFKAADQADVGLRAADFVPRQPKAIRSAEFRFAFANGQEIA